MKAGRSCFLFFLFTSVSLGDVILPPDGSTLNYIHVPFRWETAGFAFGAGSNAAYQLQVVEDNGQPDPFVGNPSVVFLFNIEPHASRTTVTSGLAFGKSYAWRARGFEYDPFPWGPTHRFSTAPLPAFTPARTVTTSGMGPVQPGITLLSMISLSGAIPGSGVFFLAVDVNGNVVWHKTFPGPGGLGNDIRLLENGRLLWIGTGERGYEGTIDGRISWASPVATAMDNRVHHEIFPMPDGNFLTALFEFRDVKVAPGVTQRWRGDKLVVFDRETNDVIWSWSTFDYLSTLDFDATTMVAPDTEGSFRWTWTNAVVYNEADNSVYVSLRHLSRIARIDYATGDIVYNMGFDMPSGNVDFGDNLFSFEHAVDVLPNGHLMIYDNGNRRDHMDQTNATGFTRAIEVEITGDPPSGASIVWEYRVPEYNNFIGDADRQPNGNTLVSAGGGVTRTEVIEVDAAAQELWRLTINPGPPTWRIYRSERIASLIVDTPGDSDGDWDVDVRDYGQFQACFTGPGPADLEFPCTLSDTDHDDDVDMDDLTTFVGTTTGPL